MELLGAGGGVAVVSEDFITFFAGSSNRRNNRLHPGHDAAPFHQ